MKRSYLIDSENINEIWVELLEALEEKDDILIFYTDKSAHMGYDKIIRLMEQKKGTLHWIRCFEGPNALDFQLVTELGYRICQEPKKEYVIVSNDTGYDVVVRYWTGRGLKVRRIKGSECESMVALLRKERERKLFKRDEQEENEEPKTKTVKPDSKIGETDCGSERSGKTEDRAEKAAHRAKRADRKLEKPDDRMEKAGREVPEPVQPYYYTDDIDCTGVEWNDADCGDMEVRPLIDACVAEPEDEPADESAAADLADEAVKESAKRPAKEPVEDCEEDIAEEWWEEPEEETEEPAERYTSARSGADKTAWDSEILNVFADCGSRDAAGDMDFLTALCKTVKVSNMSLMHNVLEYQFGQRIGNGIYKIIKSSPACRSKLSAGYVNSKRQREREYLRLVLKRNGMSEADADNILRIINGLPKKNLSAIHTSLVKKFGQEQGSRYYAALRSHVKIIRGL